VFGKPTALFADDYDFGPGQSANYHVAPDGRFIMFGATRMAASCA